MASSIRWVSIDCADPYPLCQFYGAVTGWDTDGDPGDDECVVLPPAPDHPGLLFTRVPEGKFREPRHARPLRWPPRFLENDLGTVW